MEKEVAEKIKIGAINVELFEPDHVRAIPTLVLYVNAEVKGQWVGAPENFKLNSMIDSALNVELG